MHFCELIVFIDILVLLALLLHAGAVVLASQHEPNEHDQDERQAPEEDHCHPRRVRVKLIVVYFGGALVGVGLWRKYLVQGFLHFFAQLPKSLVLHVLGHLLHVHHIGPADLKHGASLKFILYRLVVLWFVKGAEPTCLGHVAAAWREQS